MGRIRMGVKEMAQLAACIKRLAHSDEPIEELENCYPEYIITST
jgi:hypothetical protein